jgi:hypothetical protein
MYTKVKLVTLIYPIFCLPFKIALVHQLDFTTASFTVLFYVTFVKLFFDQKRCSILIVEKLETLWYTESGVN